MKKIKLRKRNFLILCIVFSILVVVFLAFLFTRKDNKIDDNETRGPSTAKEIGEIVAKNDKPLLEIKDYQAYQDSKLGVAIQANSTEDYETAKKLLNEVLLNVPEEEISSDIYGALSYTYKKLNDTVNYKKFVMRTIEVLNKNDKKVEAELWSNELAQIQ